MILFLMASIPAMLSVLCLAGFFTYILYEIGLTSLLCAVYFVGALWVFGHDMVTTTLPLSGDAPMGVIVISSKAY